MGSFVDQVFPETYKGRFRFICSSLWQLEISSHLVHNLLLLFLSRQHLSLACIYSREPFVQRPCNTVSHNVYLKIVIFISFNFGNNNNNNNNKTCPINGGNRYRMSIEDWNARVLNLKSRCKNSQIIAYLLNRAVIDRFRWRQHPSSQLRYKMIYHLWSMYTAHVLGKNFDEMLYLQYNNV